IRQIDSLLYDRLTEGLELDPRPLVLRDESTTLVPTATQKGLIRPGAENQSSMGLIPPQGGLLGLQAPVPAFLAINQGLIIPGGEDLMRLGISTQNSSAPTNDWALLANRWRQIPFKEKVHVVRVKHLNAVKQFRFLSFYARLYMRNHND